MERTRTASNLHNDPWLLPPRRSRAPWQVTAFVLRRKGTKGHRCLQGAKCQPAPILSRYSFFTLNTSSLQNRCEMCACVRVFFGKPVCRRYIHALADLIQQTMFGFRPSPQPGEYCTLHMLTLWSTSEGFQLCTHITSCVSFLPGAWEVGSPTVRARENVFFPPGALHPAGSPW